MQHCAAIPASAELMLTIFVTPSAQSSTFSILEFTVALSLTPTLEQIEIAKSPFF